MDIQQMRDKITHLLIHENEGSVDMAKRIGIGYRSFNRFLLGLQKSSVKTLMRIEIFLKDKEGLRNEKE